MSWRTVVITRRCKLDFKMGFMVIRSDEVTRVFLDEIAVLIIESTAVSLTALIPDKNKSVYFGGAELIGIDLSFFCSDINMLKMIVLSFFGMAGSVAYCILRAKRPYIGYGQNVYLTNGRSDCVFCDLTIALNLLVLLGIFIGKLIGSIVSYAKNKIG